MTNLRSSFMKFVQSSWVMWYFKEASTAWDNMLYVLLLKSASSCAVSWFLTILFYSSTYHYHVTVFRLRLLKNVCPIDCALHVCISLLEGHLWYTDVFTGSELMNGYVYPQYKMCLQLVIAAGSLRVLESKSFRLWPRQVLENSLLIYILYLRMMRF